MKVWHDDLGGWLEHGRRRPGRVDRRVAAIDLPVGVSPSRRVERFLRSMPAVARVPPGRRFQREGTLNQWVFAVLDGAVAVTVREEPVAVLTSGAWIAESLHPTITATALTALVPVTVAVFDIRQMNTARALIPGFETALLRAGRHGPAPRSRAAARYGWL